MAKNAARNGAQNGDKRTVSNEVLDCIFTNEGEANESAKNATNNCAN